MRRGRPVLGGIMGLLFFLFVAVDLLLLGVIPLHSPWLTVVPVLGAVLGVVWGRWAPLGSVPSDPPTRAEAS
ncbi:MAG: hypothetical protein ACRD0A_10925 [Acidimicrobiales bacterium]